MHAGGANTEGVARKVLHGTPPAYGVYADSGTAFVSALLVCIHKRFHLGQLAGQLEVGFTCFVQLTAPNHLTLSQLRQLQLCFNKVLQMRSPVGRATTGATKASAFVNGNNRSNDSIPHHVGNDCCA